MPRAGFEPATTRSSASPSNEIILSRALSQAELPRQHLHSKKCKFAFKFSELITAKSEVQVFLSFQGRREKKEADVSFPLAPRVSQMEIGYRKILWNKVS